MDSDCARFQPSDSAKPFRVVRVPGRADGHRIGKSRRPKQAIADSKFEIRRNQQR